MNTVIRILVLSLLAATAGCSHHDDFEKLRDRVREESGTGGAAGGGLRVSADCGGACTADRACLMLPEGPRCVVPCQQATGCPEGSRCLPAAMPDADLGYCAAATDSY